MVLPAVLLALLDSISLCCVHAVACYGTADQSGLFSIQIVGQPRTKSADLGLDPPPSQDP